MPSDAACGPATRRPAARCEMRRWIDPSPRRQPEPAVDPPDTRVRMRPLQVLGTGVLLREFGEMGGFSDDLPCELRAVFVRRATAKHNLTHTVSLIGGSGQTKRTASKTRPEGVKRRAQEDFECAASGVVSDGHEAVSSSITPKTMVWEATRTQTQSSGGRRKHPLRRAFEPCL